MNGTLYASSPDCIYASARTELGDKAIIVAYEDPVITSDKTHVVAVNCAAGEYLYFDGFKGKGYRVVNCMGETVADGVISSDIEKIAVPTAGMAYVN